MSIQRRNTAALLIIMIASLSTARAEGTKWPVFKKNLYTFFATDLVNDISNHETLIDNYVVWSWDAGDFSGDGYADLAMTVKTPTTRGRKMKVLFFADIDGYLEKVGELEKEYVDLPLEVGVAIREGAVFITEKQKQYEWEIKGYSLINGEFLLVEDFVTKSAGGVTTEYSYGYKNRPSRVRILETNNNKILFDYKFLVTELAKGTRNPVDHPPYLIHTGDVKGIEEGAYWWDGWNDLSFTAGFSLHGDNLIVELDVLDDKVLTLPYFETVDIALATGNIDRNPKKVAGGYSLPKPELGITAISFIPFGKTAEQMDAFIDIDGIEYTNTSYAFKSDEGYKARIFIPLIEAGIDLAMIEGGGELYYHITVNDRDDPENPDRVTSFGTTSYSLGNPLYWNTLRLPEDPLSTLSQKNIRVLKDYGY